MLQNHKATGLIRVSKYLVVGHRIILSIGNFFAPAVTSMILFWFQNFLCFIMDSMLGFLDGGFVELLHTLHGILPRYKAKLT